MATLKSLPTHTLMTNNPFLVRQIQVLEITSDDNPKIDIQKDRLLISACINQVDTLISVPLSSAIAIPTTEKDPPKTKSVVKPRPARRRSYAAYHPIGKSRQGELNGMAKLSQEEVLEIKQFLLDSTYMNSFNSKTQAYKDLATVYNVTHSCIMLIDTNRTWKHVTV